MRRLAVFCGCLALLAGGCGGDDEAGSSAAGDALSYLPADSQLVVLVSTDLERYQDLIRDTLGQDPEATLRQGASQFGASYERDVEPLLGNDLVIGLGDALAYTGLANPQRDRDPNPVIALDTDDAEGLKALIEQVPNVEAVGELNGATLYSLEGEGEEAFGLAVDGEVLVIGTLRAREEALARRDTDEHLTEEQVSERLGPLSSNAPIRVFGEVAPALDLPQLERFRGLPWVDALRSFSVTIDSGSDGIALDAFLATDPSEISEDDLPVATGDDAPEVVDRDREVAGGNRNQSQTTVFLLRGVRHAYPQSRFVAEVDALEQDLGINFETEILRQFDGPSASAVSPDGRTFAARSAVSDPEQLAVALDAIAPRLPQLIDGLQGLEAQGMALLFLLAPDTVALEELQDIRVEAPQGEGDLYRVSGLSGEGPSQLHFGLVGDVFVVGSTEEAAREIAEEDTIEAEGASGAAVLRAKLDQLDAEEGDLGPTICSDFGLSENLCRELVASVEASTDGLQARVRIKLSEEP